MADFREKFRREVDAALPSVDEVQREFAVRLKDAFQFAFDQGIEPFDVMGHASMALHGYLTGVEVDLRGGAQ